MFSGNQLSLAAARRPDLLAGGKLGAVSILQRRSEDARHELAFISPRHDDHLEMEYPERHDGDSSCLSAVN